MIVIVRWFFGWAPHVTNKWITSVQEFYHDQFETDSSIESINLPEDLENNDDYQPIESHFVTNEQTTDHSRVPHFDLSIIKKL